MTYGLHQRQLVRAELPTVFSFFKDPRNLEAITPPWLGFRVLTASDGEVREGTRVCYRLRLHGIPLRRESRITEHEVNARFADAMVGDRTGRGITGRRRRIDERLNLKEMTA